MTERRWPDAPDGLTPDKGAELLYFAQLEDEKARVAAERKRDNAQALEHAKGAVAAEQARLDEAIAIRKAQHDAHLASIEAFHAALMEVASASIDRARAGAELVQKAAVAIATLYTGVLALAFSVSERPLPSRGLVPAVMLGWAIVWCMVYLAYLSKPREVTAPKAHSDLAIAALRRSVTFIEWTRSSAMNRAYALRASVVSLALALALLPAPFVTLGGADGGDGWWWIMLAGAILLSLVVPAGIGKLVEDKEQKADDEKATKSGTTQKDDAIPAPGAVAS